MKMKRRGGFITKRETERNIMMIKIRIKNNMKRRMQF